MVKNLVFLAGWSFKAEIWQKQESYFKSRGFNVILSEPEKITALLNGIDLKESVFVAWSLGWYKLLDILKNRQELPKSIIGVSCATSFRQPLMRSIVRSFRQDGDKLLLDFDKWLFSAKEKASNNFSLYSDIIAVNRIHDKEILLRDLLFLERINLEAGLVKFDFPVFLIAGKDDIICPLEDAEILRRRLPCSSLEVMDAGHMPFLTESGEFNRITEEYISRL